VCDDAAAAVPAEREKRKGIDTFLIYRKRSRKK
jgi:hypothetical protein